MREAIDPSITNNERKGEAAGEEKIDQVGGGRGGGRGGCGRGQQPTLQRWIRRSAVVCPPATAPRSTLTHEAATHTQTPPPPQKISQQSRSTTRSPQAPDDLMLSMNPTRQ
jgi:hypothetical protein